MKFLRHELLLVCIISLAVLISLLSVGANYSAHHPDERHYTDAAIQMAKSADYLTPRTPMGGLRFRKPIATYWLVTSGHWLFGVTPFASRFFFVVAGASIVFLTFLIADTLYNRKELSVLAAAIVAIHPAMLITASRSIPDIVLALCLTVSTLGFVRFMASENRSSIHLLLGYVGAGLAVQSKGIPGVVFLLSVLMTMLATDRKTQAEYRRQHLLGAIVFVCISVSWFAVMFMKHGSVVLNQFLRDQVANRVEGAWLQPVVDLPLVGFVFVLGFAPWLPLIHKAIRRCWKKGFNASNTDRCSVALLVSWCVVFLGLACFVNRVNLRYQMAIAPMSAIVLTGLIGQLELIHIERHAKRMLNCLAGIALMVTIAFAANQPQLRWMILAGLVLSLAGHSIVRRRLTRATPTNRRVTFVLSGVSVLTLCIVPAAFLAIGHQRGTFCETALQVLKEHDLHDQPIVLVGKPAYAARLRVQSQGVAQVTCFRSSTSYRQTFGQYVEPTVLMIANAKGPKLSLNKYEVVEVPHGFANLKPTQLVSSFMKGELNSYLDSCRRSAKIAIHRRFLSRNRLHG